MFRAEDNQNRIEEGTEKDGYGDLSEKDLDELKLELERLVFLTGSEVLPEEEGDLFETEEENGLVAPGSYVKISEDEMGARLFLRPWKDEHPYEEETIYEFLNHNGITVGYHKSNIAAIVKKKVYEREVMVAEGKQVINGTDGYFEYMINPQKLTAPEIRPDGTADYTSMKALQNIKKGEPIARYIHAVQGENGYTVKDTVIKARTSRELPPLRGHCYVDEKDPDLFLADKEGKIEVKGSRVDIQAVHEIMEDVDLTFGKVEFYGDIIIHGNVGSGVVIRAGRNIRVEGVVEGATLFAGGDIILGRGLLGGQRAKISARGNVLSNFIEYAVVTAGVDVQANYIMNSRVSADGAVKLAGARGSLIGGYTHGLQGVEVASVGNATEVRTVVHAGCEAEIYYKTFDIKKREKEVQDQLKKMTSELEKMIRQRRMNNDKMDILMEDKFQELQKTKTETFQTLESINQDKDMIAKTMDRGKDAKIIVNGNIYRGTIISIVQMQMPIEHNTCFMKYEMVNSMITGSVVVYKEGFGE